MQSSSSPWALSVGSATCFNHRSATYSWPAQKAIANKSRNPGNPPFWYMMRSTYNTLITTVMMVKTYIRAALRRQFFFAVYLAIHLTACLVYFELNKLTINYRTCYFYVWNKKIKKLDNRKTSVKLFLHYHHLHSCECSENFDIIRHLFTKHIKIKK